MLKTTMTRNNGYNNGGSNGNSNANDRRSSSLLYLETASQVQSFLSSSSTATNSLKTIRLASKLFGPPNMSLPYRQRRQLFETIGTFMCKEQENDSTVKPKTLRSLLSFSQQQPEAMDCTQQQNTNPCYSLIIEGTIMGQVLPGELIALGIFPSSPLSSSLPVGLSKLQVLEIHNGLVFDSLSTSILDLAMALSKCPNLQKLSLRNFLNHVRPITIYEAITATATTNNDNGNNSGNNGTITTMAGLLDPLLHALSTTTTSSSTSSMQIRNNLEYLELSCLASFVPWKRPLISTTALESFLINNQKNSTNRPLRYLELTNLGLEDDHIDTLIQSFSKSSASSSSSCSLQELVWNGNENTIHGLRALVQAMTMPVATTTSMLRTTTATPTATTISKNPNKFSTISPVSPILFGNLIRLSIMNHVKLTHDVFELLVRTLQSNGYTTIALQSFSCTMPVSQQAYYTKSLQLYLRLHSLPLQQYYYGDSNQEWATPGMCIEKILAPISNDLNALYLLLREKPNLCNTARNKDTDMKVINMRNNNNNHDNGIGDYSKQHKNTAKALFLLLLWLSQYYNIASLHQVQTKMILLSFLLLLTLTVVMIRSGSWIPFPKYCQLNFPLQ